MKNWRGAGGISPSSSNLSASAPPFTVPRAFPYPNSTPYADLAEGSSIVPPVNWDRDGWESTAVLNNRYLGGPSHEVDADVPYANYYPFKGPDISGEINTQLPSWDLPVTVTSTDCGVSHALSSSNLGKEVEVGPCYLPYSSFGVSGRDSLLTTNHTCYVGPSAPKPGDGKSDKSSIDGRTIGFSIVSDVWDDRLDRSAVGYPLKNARTDERYQLEEDKLTGEHVPKSCNGQDAWSNVWDGPAVNYPLESAHVEGNNWLGEGQRASQHLAGTSNQDVAWNDGWARPAVEYPFKSDREVGEESSHFDLATDIWKQQAGNTQSCVQSTWWHGPNTDYESLVMKSPSAPATQLRADVPGVAVGFVTRNKCSNDIDGDNANFVDMMPFHSMESYPLLGPPNKIQFDATYSRIQPDTNAFEKLHMAKDEVLPKDNFSSINSFDLIPQSNSTSRFSSLYLENSAVATSTHLAGDEAGSDPWGFRVRDWAANTCFSGTMKTDDQPVWDGLYTQDIPIQCPTEVLFQENEVGNTNQAVSVEGSQSLFEPPAVSDTSDREQGFDGIVEAGSCGLKEIQSPHGTYRTIASKNDDLQVLSHNLGVNSCFPMQQKLSDDERTSHDGHPCGECVDMNDKGVQKLAKDSEEGTSALVQEISGSNFSAPVSWNLSGQEKGQSAPKVDLKVIVLTLHNLSELLQSYCSNGKCEVREEDRHLLEKAIHKLEACSAKNVIQTEEKEELKNSKVEPSQCLEGSTELYELNGQTNGDEKQINSLCNGKERNSLEMLPPGVDLPILKDNDLTRAQDNYQILCDGKQQTLEEGKLCFETFSSPNSHPVKDDNMVQAIKEILSKNYPAAPESDPHDHLFRNLWLEAEAELCSLKCKARFDLFKSKLNAPEIKESFETTTAVEKPSNSEVSGNFVAEDNISCTNILEKNQKAVGSPRSCGNAKAGGERDVVASFNIPGSCCDDQNSPNYTIEEKKIPMEVCLSNMAGDAGADFLCQKAGMSPHISCSSTVKGTAGSGENIDAIMSRFNILLQRDERLGSQQNCSINTEAVKSRLEQNTCHGDFPEQNKAEELKSSLSEDRGITSPLVTESFVMSRLNIIKQRDENASSVENAVYQENAEVEPGEQPVDRNEAGEINCLSPNIERYYDKLCSSGSAEWTRDSVLDILKIMKQSDENQISAEKFGFGECVDLGSAIRGDYLSNFRGRTAEGSVAKDGHVSQAKACPSADDASKMDTGLGREDRSANSSCLSGKQAGIPFGWFDVSSSDWEHVLKEEVAGGTSER